MIAFSLGAATKNRPVGLPALDTPVAFALHFKSFDCLVGETISLGGT